jgi:hypothetical protein
MRAAMEADELPVSTKVSRADQHLAPTIATEAGQRGQDLLGSMPSSARANASIISDDATELNVSWAFSGFSRKHMDFSRTNKGSSDREKTIIYCRYRSVGVIGLIPRENR